MHYVVRSKLTHWASTILLVGAAWFGAPSDTATAAASFNGTHSADEVDDSIANLLKRRSPRRPIPPQVTDFQLIELLVIACREHNCREVSLLYDAYEMSLMTCMIVGQQEAARWQSSNPPWLVKRWSCRFMRSTEGST